MQQVTKTIANYVCDGFCVKINHKQSLLHHKLTDNIDILNYYDIVCTYLMSNFTLMTLCNRRRWRSKYYSYVVREWKLSCNLD